MRPVNHISVPGHAITLAVEISGTGDPLIFAHGLTANRHHTKKQLKPMMDRYQVISFDQRGHCDSTPVTDHRLYDVSTMADDIQLILDELEIDKAIVGGESMGAATALVFAMNHQDRVETLLLSRPALCDSPFLGRRQLQLWADSIARTSIDAFVDSLYDGWRGTGKSDNAMAYWAAILRSHQAQSLATACASIGDWRPLDTLDDLAHLNVPVRILAADGDMMHPRELAERMVTILPNATMGIVPPPPIPDETPAVFGSMFLDLLDA